MNLFFCTTVLLITTFLGSGCASVPSCSSDPFRITISKGACFGKCSVYSATFESGKGAEESRITVNNKENTPVRGTTTSLLTTEDRCALETLLADTTVFTTQYSALAEVPDAPVTSMTIAYRGRSVQVQWNLSTPTPLKALHDKLKVMVENEWQLKTNPTLQTR